MAGFVGMDIEQVRQLAQVFSSEADKIEATISAISPQVEGAEWKGTDAEQFKGDWQSIHVPALKNVATALRDAQTRATTNADQQEQVSAS